MKSSKIRLISKLSDRKSKRSESAAVPFGIKIAVIEAMKTLIPTLILIFVILSSCSKEQRIVNRMQGKWTVTEAEIANIGTVEPNMVFKFEYCKQRLNDFCDYSLHDFDQDETTNGTYSIGDDGESVILSDLSGWGNNFEEFEIEKLNSRRLRLVNYNAENGEYRRFELRSIE